MSNPIPLDGAKCIQSSQYSNEYPASNAVTGDAKFSHTKEDSEAYWECDLGKKFEIHRVEIANRLDGQCHQRLSNFMVLISEKPFKSSSLKDARNVAGWHHHQQQHQKDFQFQVPKIKGRYLRVQLVGKNYLHFSRIAVFGSGDKKSSADKQAVRSLPGNPGRLDTFHTNSNKELVRINCDGKLWNSSVIHSSQIKVDSEPFPLVGFNNARIDVFWRSDDNCIYDTYSFNNGASWTTSKLGGQNKVQSDPVGMAAPGKIECYWASSGNIYTTRWNGNSWVDALIGGEGIHKKSSLSAVTGYQPNRIDIFWKSKDKSIYSTWWNGSKWTDSKIGGNGNAKSSPVGISGFQQGRLDVFWRGKDNCLWDTWWNGNSWQDSKVGGNGRVGGDKPSPVVGFRPNRIDVFWKGKDKTVWQTLWDGSWKEFQVGGKSGSVASDVVAHSGFQNDRLDIFWRGKDGCAHCTQWAGVVWADHKIF